jgi:alpha-L-glutamate ligase-like protein
MFGFWQRFHQAGIVGINARNRDYIYPHNRRRYFRLVDDKLETKRLCATAGIPTPELYAVIAYQNQVKLLDQMIGERKRFVVKPSQGSGGAGIVVVEDRTPTGYRKASGALMTETEMRYHLNNVLSGMHSLGGINDKVLVEYAVRFDPVFAEITYQGVPDIRVLLYQGIPAMAMLRLPTRASDGKANLHKGGLGVGVNMRTGTTMNGVQKGRFIDRHPETGHLLSGRQIPHWEQILRMASRFYGITQLGYLGVDIVLDRELGPLVLEVNARPGLAIQVANQCGLLSRLPVIDAADPAKLSEAERVAFAMERF